MSRGAPNVLTVEQAARLIAACPRTSALERRDRLAGEVLGVKLVGEAVVAAEGGDPG